MSIEFKYHNIVKQTINSFLLKKWYSDNNIYYLIKNKNIIVNGNVVKDKNYLLYFNSVIKVRLNDEVNELECYNSELDIAYEDKYLLIVNKPANLDIEPTKLNNTNTLANTITHYFKNNDIKSKVHLVNRLDKMTQGLVIVAKNQYIHNLMSKTKIIKKYKALVLGKTQKKGLINVNIKKDENSIKRIVSKDGKKCLTKYKLISFNNDTSLVDIRILTGRTHQIRVSFAHIKHPLVGDPLYNDNKSRNTMYLNAYYINFTHPITKKKIVIIK